MPTVSETPVGTVLENVLVENLTRTQIVQYAGASGDFNPLHTDEIYARDAAGYPGVFSHGMLTMALTARMLTDRFGHQSLAEFGLRFTGQVWPGDTLTARAVVESIDSDPSGPLAELTITTSAADGRVVAKGHATARLDA